MDIMDDLRVRPSESCEAGDMVEKKDPESYIYDDHDPSSKKETSVGRDGHLDPETAEISADVTLDTALQLVTKTLDITDNATESPYTFRAFALGLGLSAFGAVLSEIFYFKPMSVAVSPIFLIILAYFFGETAALLPRWGAVGRFLNPGPFNLKEHTFMVIMSSSAATSALGCEVLAAQDLFYGDKPNAAFAIFMLLSSQCVGYGLLGAMRKMYIYPTKFVWPTQLPLASLLQSMHLDKQLAKKRLCIFWCVCGFVMVWELVPEYLFPMTAGFSIFCLANQHSAAFTRIFGGSNGDEGLGVLGWSFDWQDVTTLPFVLPMNTLVNELIGYVGCLSLFIGAYYMNLWNAQNFPFLAQDLFLANGSLYNQTMILDEQNVVDPVKLQEYGVPWFSTSSAIAYLCLNMGVTAAVVHTFLWHWDDVKSAFSWLSPAGIRRVIDDMKKKEFLKFRTSEPVGSYPGTEGDPHFLAMRAYADAPSWWYHAVLVVAIVIGLICSYKGNTGLPWWAFLLAIAIAWFLTTFFAALYGVVGFYYQPTNTLQMLAGYMIPRRPVANMMFTLYGSNALVQAILMLGDLKLAYYTKLAPRAAFTAQMLGTLIGAILNWVVMKTIVKNERDVLLSVEGTNLWSGQWVQTYNAQAVAWSGASNEIFGRHGQYWMIPMGLLFGCFAPLPFWIGHKFFPKLRLDYFNTFIICTWFGWLSAGANSAVPTYFAIGFFVQGFVRRYRPILFAKWNMIVAAAIAGGCAIMVFILTFAVAGGSGTARPFPVWWGNNLGGNFDRCLFID